MLFLRLFKFLQKERFSDELKIKCIYYSGIILYIHFKRISGSVLWRSRY